MFLSPLFCIPWKLANTHFNQTLSELMRCLQELTRVKITHFTEDELRAADDAFIAFLQSKRKPQPVKPTIQPQSADSEKKRKEVEKLPPEEVALRERWTKLLEMVRKGRLESLQTQWTALLAFAKAIDGSVAPLPLGPLPTSSDPTSDTSSASQSLPPLVDTRIPSWVREEDGVGPGGTLLHAATAAGQETVVQWLLIEQRADPTILLPLSTSPSINTQKVAIATPTVSDDEDESALRRSITGGRKAYDLASSRSMRNVFRRAAYEHPDWWDWLGGGGDGDDGDDRGGGAHVPSALSPEMEEAEQRKKSARRKGLKERMKEREEARKAELERAEKERAAAAAVTAASVLATGGGSRKAGGGGPQRLGGSGAAIGSANQATLDAMPPEMRARIERERRARAAEARVRTLGERGSR